MRRATGRKASEGDLLAAISNNPDIRLFLLYGPDEGQIEGVARVLVKAVGDGAERIEVDATTTTLEAGALSDAAASMSLFGSRSFVRLRLSADRAVEALQQLLDSPHGGNVVIATAGNLTPASKTRKLAETHPLALILGCYPDGQADAERRVIRLALEHGLDVDEAGARRIVALAGGDRTLAAIEIEKLVLYMDAHPGQMLPVPIALITELGAQANDDNLDALIAASLGGKAERVGAELATARQMGIDAIRIVKTMQARVAKLSGLSAQQRPGETARELVKRDRSIHRSWHSTYARELEIWKPVRLAVLNQRIIDLEMRMMRADGMADILLGGALLAIARSVRAGR